MDPRVYPALGELKPKEKKNICRPH